MSKEQRINYADFLKVEVLAGTIVQCKSFERALKPALQLEIDFGHEIGIKRSSAQITQHYTPDKLIGSQVIAVVNFAPKQIANFISEVLVLGVSDSNGHVVLLQPQQQVPNGARMH